MTNKYVLKSNEKGLVEDAKYPKYPLYTTCRWKVQTFDTLQEAYNIKREVETNTKDKLIVCIQDEYRNAIEIKYVKVKEKNDEEE